MYEEDIKEICRKLKPIIGRRADKLWLAYATSENNIDKQQMQAAIQAVAARHLSDKVDDTTILLPPPALADSLGEFYLGDVIYGSEKIFKLHFERSDIVKHSGIFGITGSGKTVACKNIIKNLLKADIPFIIVDWKRSFRDLAPDDIVIYSIGRRAEHAINWNPLRPPPGVHPKTWISIISEILERSHLSGPGSGFVLSELLDERFEKMGFYGDSKPELYPNFFDIKEDLMKLNKKGRQGLWKDTSERIIRSLTFGPSSGAFNARHPIKLEELLGKKIVFELDQELPRSLRTFFSEVILRFVHLWALHTGESNELRMVLVLEEIHNLFGRSQFEKSAPSGLETIAKELRSFGIGLIALSQNPSLLPTWLLGNLNCLIFMALQHADDVQAASKALFLERGDERYFGYLKVGEGIVRIQGRVNPCHVRFPAPGT